MLRGRPRGQDAAVSAVVGTMLLVALAAVCTAGVYAWASSFDRAEGGPPTMALVSQGHGCRASYLVAAVPKPPPLDELRVDPPSGATDSMIAFAGRAVSDASWTGQGLPSRLAAGAELDLWAVAGADEAFVVHEPTNSIIARARVPNATPDATPPSASVLAPASLAAGTLSGTATDQGCSGVMAVTVTIRALGLPVWSGDATLAAPGEASTAWTAALPAGAFASGVSYTIEAIAQDAAGNTSPPASRTIVEP